MPRIAIPWAHSTDLRYNDRALPDYERAVEQAGGVPVRIPLDQTPAATMKLIETCDGVLLPGSNADVDPAKYDAPRDPRCAAADPARDTVDELLLQDAFNMRKPIFGICYGLQSLNVYCSGSLIQHLETPVNHEIGRKVEYAHKVNVVPGSMLARIVGDEPTVTEVFESGDEDAPSPAFDANSSHHQAADRPGDGLRVVARAPEDGVIEALEGINPEHWVLAVQWHPERTVGSDEPSRALFRAFVQAATARHQQLTGEFESVAR